jgi:hypothetical protein
MKEKLYMTMNGTFKQGKSYSTIEYHIKEIRKDLEESSFSITVKTEPTVKKATGTKKGA